MVTTSATPGNTGGYNATINTEARGRAAGAISWGAILGGAVAAAALSLILLLLGVGLGMSSVSPWSFEGVSATTFGVSTIVWLTLTQLLASGLGGYLAGRLRVRWSDAARDEVYFRDTAHGFLAWAVATLSTAALLTSVVGGIVGGGVQAASSVAGGVAKSAAAAGGGAATAAAMSEGGSAQTNYFVDSLFRAAKVEAAPPDAAAPAATTAAAPAPARTSPRDHGEVGRIFMNVARGGQLPPEDVRHVGQLVAERTGLPQAEAEKRVTETFARAQAQLTAAEAAARDAADKARQASAYAALWMFISLLVGAFIASLAATYGGRQRDA